MKKVLRVTLCLVTAISAPHITPASQKLNRLPAEGQPIADRGRRVPSREERRNAEKLYRRGVEHGLAGRYAEAAEAFEQSLALNPHVADAHFGLGHAHFDMGRWTEAVARLKEAARLNPQDPEAFQMLGVAYSKLGSYENALEAFRRAVLLRPDWVEARYNLGTTFYKLGQYSAAVGYLTEVTVLKSNNAEAYNDLGASYGQLGRDDEAVKALRRALRLKSDHAYAHNNLGLVHYRRGRYEEARDAFRRALELSPNDSLIRDNLDLATRAARSGNSEMSARRESGQVSPGAGPRWLIRTTLDAEAPASAPTRNLVASLDPSVQPPRAPELTATPARPQPEAKAVPTGRAALTSLPPATTDAAPDVRPSTEMRTEPPAPAPAPVDVYRIGAGDMLDIRFLNQPTAGSTLYTVLAGGLLEYPPLGAPLMVAGLTTDEIDERITAELERRGVAQNPEVVVSVREYASHVVIVSGLVAEPGNKIIRREAIPLYVVLADAQPAAEAGRVEINSHRTGKRTVVDLADQTAMNALIYPGDVLTVSARPPQYYYVGGEIAQPGQKEFHEGITLTQAILAAGGSLNAGPGATRAWTRSVLTAGVISPSSKAEVRVTRQGADGRLTTVKYNLREIMEGKLPDPPLQAGDRIEINQ